MEEQTRAGIFALDRQWMFLLYQKHNACLVQSEEVDPRRWMMEVKVAGPHSLSSALAGGPSSPY